MSDQERDEAAGYRPVSGLAVAALMAGCGSALVLFTSLAAVVPLVAIALAGAALVDLKRSAGRRVGRPLALAGLALAVGFTAQAAGGAFVERWIAGRRASATARAWIEAVREKRFGDAIGLCSPTALPATGRDPFDPPPDDAERLAAFESLPAVAAIAGCGSPPAVVTGRAPSGEGAWLVRVELDSCDAGGETVRLEVAPRSAARGRQPVERWLVTGFELQR
jgi:hypothetical protein